jgi:hypothetical protein
MIRLALVHGIAERRDGIPLQCRSFGTTFKFKSGALVALVDRMTVTALGLAAGRKAASISRTVSK